MDGGHKTGIGQDNGVRVYGYDRKGIVQFRDSIGMGQGIDRLDRDGKGQLYNKLWICVTLAFNLKYVGSIFLNFPRVNINILF